ncbi:MAG: 1-acyl-sn-glycerol-3-phosphate acyltransferase [Candidatus Hydrogenedentes bacterium]|nr:1-acyl-sn-glycerol-3-phosphate acyltransferase [Candidatus Hydrogenedentota bacterium]
MSRRNPPLLTRLWCWAVTLYLLFRYVLYRLHLGKRPSFVRHWWRVEVAYRQITRMDPRIRVRHTERCPKQHPAVYVGNHLKLDDQFFVCYAVQEASDYTMKTRFVMRDDYFGGFPWNWIPIDMNEVAEMGGSYNIAQGSPSLAQLKPLIDILLEPDSFVIFPCGGRSRSGHWLEVHTGGDEPGSVAFFVAQAQRRNPDLPVPGVPVGRTYNPIKKVSAVIVGTPRHLEPNARREAQRDFDAALFCDLSDLVELHMLHFLSMFIYLKCLHQHPPEVAKTVLADAVRRMRDALRHRYLDPALDSDFDRDLRDALDYLRRQRILNLRGDRILLDPATVLACPEMDTRYRTVNPVKYHVNQILHLADVVARCEREVLSPSR